MEIYLPLPSDSISVTSSKSTVKSKVLLPLTRNDGCQQIGVVSKGLDQLSTLPTLSLKLDTLTLANTGNSFSKAVFHMVFVF